MKKALFIGYIWPEPRSSAAGARSMSLIRAFGDAGYEVHYASPAKAGQHDEALRARGVRTHRVAPNDPDFDAWIAELAPEVAVIERFMMEEQFGWRVARFSPGTLRVLETSDLHFLRQARKRALEPPPEPAEGQVRPDDTELREIASIYRSDLSLIISPHELALLTSPLGEYRVPAELLHELSFCYDPSPHTAVPAAQAFGERAGFVMIGNFRHEPNADAVRWLKREIWPRVRALLPQAQVHVYGAYAPREMMALDDAGTGFRMKGAAGDQFAVLGRYRVNLAPLRFGAGLKGKISDGWWAGTPCVATPVGAEGMERDGRSADGEALRAPRFGGLVAETADELAEASIRLHEDPATWQPAREAGLGCVRERFDHAENASRLVARIEGVLGDLERHRRRNFTGRMLAHHLHRGTEYFARWIELKGARGEGRPRFE
jgi:glycosyltransferase involved in cell wall biosynthesis